MKFIWDRRKNEANIKKHELDFADAYQIFESPMLQDLRKTLRRARSLTRGLDNQR